MTYSPYAQQHATQYLEQEIQNATPAQQIVMLYDGAIKFALRAKQAIGEGDIQTRCNANRRVIDIITYLMGILDMEKGAEIALRLNRIYGKILQLCLQVDVKNSPDAVDEIVGYLKTLRKSWQDLANQPAATGAPAEGGAHAPKAKPTYGAPAEAPADASGLTSPLKRSAMA